MKKLIIAALLVVGITTFAQEKKEKPKRADMEKMTPEQRTEKRVERMTQELNLDAKQQEQLKQLYAEEAKNREILKAEMKGKKEHSREKMDDQRKVMDNKVQDILTPEQLVKWKSNQEKMKQKMQERMNNRQVGGMHNDSHGGNMEN